MPSERRSFLASGDGRETISPERVNGAGKRDCTKGMKSGKPMKLWQQTRMLSINSVIRDSTSLERGSMYKENTTFRVFDHYSTDEGTTQ